MNLGTPLTPGSEILTHPLVTKQLLGYERVRKYLGSWREWGAKIHFPVETRATDDTKVD